MNIMDIEQPNMAQCNCEEYHNWGFCNCDKDK